MCYTIAMTKTGNVATEDKDHENISPELERIRRELTRGTAELAVLALVEQRQRYGYELLKELQAAGGQMLEIKEGTLYPLLHRLEDGGFIRGEWQAENRARPRKYYNITPAGRARAQLLKGEWMRLTGAIQAFLAALEKEET